MYGKKHSKKTLRLISESKKGLHQGAGNPNAKRFADRIETVTVDSVLDWLNRTGMASGPQTVGL